MASVSIGCGILSLWRVAAILKESGPRMRRCDAIGCDEGGTNLRILSVYHGLDPLPAQAITGLCGMAPVSGQMECPLSFLPK